MSPERRDMSDKCQDQTLGGGAWVRSGDVIRRPEGKSGLRFRLPHYLLRDPLGDYLF
jgi:hypothetical protein